MSVEQAGLFDAVDCTPELSRCPGGPEPQPVSYLQRLRLRQQAVFKHGFHPVTGVRLLSAEQGQTCRGCAHLFRHDQAARNYWKCGMNATHGPATDIARRWPACTYFELRAEQ